MIVTLLSVCVPDAGAGWLPGVLGKCTQSLLTLFTQFQVCSKGNFAFISTENITHKCSHCDSMGTNFALKTFLLGSWGGNRGFVQNNILGESCNSFLDKPNLFMNHFKCLWKGLSQSTPRHPSLQTAQGSRQQA